MSSLEGIAAALSYVNDVKDIIIEHGCKALVISVMDDTDRITTWWGADHLKDAIASTEVLKHDVMTDYTRGGDEDEQDM